MDSEESYNKPQNLGQLEIGVRVKKAGLVYKLKQRFEHLEQTLEIMPFWKDITFVFMAVSSILIPLAIILTIVYKFNSLPFQIPFFYNTQTEQWILIDKGIITIIIIFYAVINLILLNIIHLVYYYDRRLAKILAINSNLANILLFIALSQILSILLI